MRGNFARNWFRMVRSARGIIHISSTCVWSLLGLLCRLSTGRLGWSRIHPYVQHNQSICCTYFIILLNSTRIRSNMCQFRSTSTKRHSKELAELTQSSSSRYAAAEATHLWEPHWVAFVSKRNGFIVNVTSSRCMRFIRSLLAYAYDCVFNDHHAQNSRRTHS